MGNILDFSKPVTAPNFSSYLDNYDFSVPVGLDTSAIPAPKKFSYDFSPDLTKSIMDKRAGTIPDERITPPKEESLMDNVMGYGGLALQFAGMMDARKTAKLQRKSLQFNLDNARELSTARKTSVGNINRVGI